MCIRDRIMGSNELNRGVVLIKDLELGSRISSQIKSHKEWKDQPAQVEISRENLIDYITKLPK